MSRPAGWVDQVRVVETELVDGRIKRSVQNERLHEIGGLQQRERLLRMLRQVLIQIPQEPGIPAVVAEVPHQAAIRICRTEDLDQIATRLIDGVRHISVKFVWSVIFRIAIVADARSAVVAIVAANVVLVPTSTAAIAVIGATSNAKRVAAAHIIFNVVTAIVALMALPLLFWTVKNTGELQLKRRKKSRILALLFGTEGELAGNALKAQKKSLRTATLSLTLSFLGFALMLSFFTLSGISTNHTYFERYQDAWDVMATLEDTKIEDFSHTDEIHALPDIDSVIYQKANAVCSIGADAVSEEVKSLGGLETVAGSDVSMADGIYTIQAPIVIMDDSSFATYCEQIGVSSAENGSVVLNRIWDNINSNFRYKEYVPFLSENQDTMTLQNLEDAAATVEIPVLGFTKEPPVLREEYDNYALVQFVSLSTWKQIEKTIGNAEPDTYIRILSEKERTLTELSMIETELTNVLGHDISFEVENRVQEKIDNDAMLNGYKLIIGALCVLLAFIGIANVFSNTLGFIRQRKREFARYMSIGMTPEGMRKMFWIEALVIAGRPVLITLPITVVFVWLMITASYLNPMEFLAVAPIVPILLFIAALFGFVALAYYLGGKKILKCDLVEALRTDYMG